MFHMYCIVLVIQAPTPWFDILTSPAVWGAIVVQFSSNYGFYVLLTTMPTYFKQAVGFDIKKVNPDSYDTSSM